VLTKVLTGVKDSITQVPQKFDPNAGDAAN
jgi:hypothetical protein